MKTHWLVLAATAAVAPGCYSVESPPVSGVGSFRVEARELSTVNADGTLQPLSVVPACIKRHGTRLEQVPLEARGKTDCRYVIPPGAVEMTVSVTAMGKSGEPLDFNGPVSFRMSPGDLAGDYGYAWVMLNRGTGEGKLRAQHLYGEVRVLVADEPVKVLYTNGTIAGDTSKLPVEPETRSYASSASAPLYFQEPTLAAIQTPQGYDNRSSPFVNQFVTVGRAPESGGALRRDCPGIADDQEMTLLITGTDPSGFFVTDITACPVAEDTSGASGVRVPEPPVNGVSYLPGTYGSMFVYNYSFPEGLYPGDLLWTLAGSIQEFTSTTQLTFPSWTVREHVRLLPQNQWDKYLLKNPPVELNLRHCFLDNTLAPFITDVLCGYNNKNLKMESLESGLVKLRRVRFPQVFKTCDLNGDNSVPFFCQTKDAAGNWIWGTCDSTNTAPDAERQCNADCTTGSGAYANTVCAERTQYTSFGQFVVEMAGPGPRDAGLDDTLTARSQVVLLSDSASRKTATAYATDTQVSVWCDQDVYMRWGDASVTAGFEDESVSAHERRDITVRAGQGSVAFLSRQATSGVTPAPRCSVSSNTHTRMLVTTRDAVPELRVDCDEADADAERARQCRLLHAATYDVVGHLRQVQAARPRWMVMPRDASDLCCHPGAGLECPRPIQKCQ